MLRPGDGVVPADLELSGDVIHSDPDFETPAMYDLVVIGGGSGGLHLATLAARVGAKVALVDKRPPGEQGWLAACVPSKGLVQAARLVRQIRGASEFGIHVEPPRVDFAAVLNRLRSVSQASAAGRFGRGSRGPRNRRLPRGGRLRSLRHGTAGRHPADRRAAVRDRHRLAAVHRRRSPD